MLLNETTDNNNINDNDFMITLKVFVCIVNEIQSRAQNDVAWKGNFKPCGLRKYLSACAAMQTKQFFSSKMEKATNRLDTSKMTIGLVQHITVIESTSIQWVNYD